MFMNIIYEKLISLTSQQCSTCIVLQYLSLVLPPFPFHSILLYILLFSSNPLLSFLLLSYSIFSLSITQLSITQPSITQPFYYSAFYYSALLLFSPSIIQPFYYSALLLSDISTSINTLDFHL